MSVSQYPNATEKAVDEMMSLLDTIMPDPPPKKLEDDVMLAVFAYMCGAMEHIIRIPEVSKLDPKVLAQVKSILRSCT